MQASRIILATGSDDYLKSLAEELARRIGRERLAVQMDYFLLLDMQTHFCFELLFLWSVNFLVNVSKLDAGV